MHLRRTRLKLVPLAVLCSAALAACGDDASKTTTAVPPPRTVDYAQYGISFGTRPTWIVIGGVRPHISTITSGPATAAIWLFPRSERLPRGQAQLERALSSLSAASRRRDATFRRIEGDTTLVDGRPGVEIRAVDSVGGKRRATRTTHIYAYGAEVVIDQFTTRADFPRADRALFQPLLRALQLGRPNP